MIERPFWLERIEAAWREAPIAWLCAVRRGGRTTLAESLGSDSAALAVFRGYYPGGRNLLVTPSGSPAYRKRFGSHEVLVCTPSELKASSAPREF